MVSYLSVVFCAVGLIGILLQNSFCSAEQQQLAEPDADLSSDGLYEDEKRGGGRAFSGFSGLKRAGGRAFNYYGGMDKRADNGRGFVNFNEMDKRAGGRGFVNVNTMDKRGGARGFNSMDVDKRGGGRAFYGFNSYNPYPLVYKKADYIPYYLETRGGARSWQVNEQEEERNKRAGARTFPVFIDESTEKRIAQ